MHGCSCFIRDCLTNICFDFSFLWCWVWGETGLEKEAYQLYLYCYTIRMEGKTEQRTDRQHGGDHIIPMMKHKIRLINETTKLQAHSTSDDQQQTA